MTHHAGTAAALASELRAWIDRLFPDPDRGERLKRALDERFGGDARAVTGDLCREVEAVAHEFSRHLELEYVADVIYRDRTRQWWTTGRLAGLAPPRETPVSVLVSERTFSSGEALAYHLQSQGRAKLVGQRTSGAADHVTPVRLGANVRALLPEARVRDAVTGSNWEATGVGPDIGCEPEEALETAVDALRQGV